MQKKLQSPSSGGLAGYARRLRIAMRTKAMAAGLLVVGSLFSTATAQAQTTIISEDFETGGTAWTLVNGTQPNKWFVGTATAAGGTQSAYISDDAAGATNTYLITTSSTTHIYQDVTFPAGQTDFQLTFKWKAQGDGTTDLDNLKVFLSAAGATVTAGTAMPAADRVGATWYNLSAGTGYTTTTIPLSPALAGTTQRLVFSWKNNATLGTQPPASIDDIIITSRAAAPISGTFTIDNTQPTAGSNFTSFTDAITKINTEGVNGPVTFNVIAGQNFTETPPVITASGTAANPIIFQRSGTGTNPKITAAAGVTTNVDGIIVLAGSDYMTFDGIDLEDPATNTTATTRMEWGYALLRGSNTNGSQFNTIKNCTVTLQKAYTTSKGIYSGSHTQFNTTSLSGTGATAAGTNSNNKIFSNTVTNVYSGIFFQGITTADFYDVNNEIGVSGANTVTNFGGSSSTTYGIYGIYQSEYKVANNVITGGTGSTSTFYGIFSSIALNANQEIYNNNLTLTSGSTTSAMYGINMSAGESGTNNLIKIHGNTIQMTYSAATSGQLYGIYSANDVFNIDIYNNTVSATKIGTGTSYGIYQFGNVGNNENIYGNTVSNVTASGTGTWYSIFSNAATSTKSAIHNNTIRDISTGSTTQYGIATTASTTSNIHSNTISNLASSPTGAALYGIYLNGGANNYVYNNFISDLKTPAATGTDAIRGIFVNSGTFNGLYFNTIYLNASSTSATNFGTTGVYASSTPTVDMRNNIIVNTSTPGATGGFTVAYRRSTTTITSYASTSNNNIFFAGAPAANRLIFYDGTNSDQTIVAFKNRVSPRDDKSTSEMPPFVNITTAPFDLHLQTSVPTSAESGGTPITSPIAITLDFDGQTRNTSTPDIGADEGNFLFADLVGPTITFTPVGNTSNTGDRTLTATISDASGMPTSGILVPRIYYRKGTSGAFVSQPGTLTSGTATNGTWTFTILSTDVGGLANGDNIDYFIVAQDVAGNLSSVPLGVVATDVNNVTALTNIYRYFINAPLPAVITVPGMFSSLSNTGGAFEAINQGVLTGNVLINITGDLTAETGAVGLNQWTEEGAGNYSLAIRPDAAVNRTISGTSAVGLGMIRLSGADRVTIDGSFNGSGRFLTLINTGTVASTLTLQVVNGAENNIIRNLNISTGSNTVSNWAFVSNGTSNTNLLLENNTFTKAQTAISIQNAATSPIVGLQIRNNSIGSQTAADYVAVRGISLSNATAPIVSGNTITLNTALSSIQAGIEIGTNVTGASVTKNIISGLRTTASQATVGIYVTSGTGIENNTIDNNMISDILSPGVASSISNPIGIRLDGGSNTKIYYNSIYLTGAQTTTGLTRSAALYVNSTNLPGLDIRNNIFANAMTGSATAKAYAVYAVSGATFGTINYNNYFVDGVNAVFGFLGADVATLAAWRTATTQDANSISVDPQFMSATDLHITTSNLALNNLGTPIAGITTDFDGDVRSTTTPDMGADEFSPASLDLGAFALVSPVNKNCFGAAEPVIVTIKNLGITPINFATTNATLTVTASVPTGAPAATFPVITLTDNTLNGGNPLAVGATLDVAVGTINMTTPGGYTFNAVTNVTTGGTDGNTANDAIDAVTITVAPLAAGTATAAQASLCQSGITTINLTGNSGGDVQWQSGTSATGPFTDIAGATSSSFTLPAAINQTTYYQAVTSCGTNSATSNVVTVTVNNPAITASAGDTRCGAGTVNLSATPSANATINWYDDATRGAPLATGPTFSPTVSTTTTFYAEANNGGLTTHVGAISNAIGTGAQSTATHYLLFDAFSAFTLNSVYVYPNAAGNVVIELRNSANAILQTATVAVTAAQIGVKTLIPVNFAIAPGTGYKIGRGSASVSLYRNETGAVYPYTIPGLLSITGNSFNPTYYYWAYDWNVSSGCGSARTAVVATVNPLPTVDLGTDITQCGNAPVTLDAGNVGATFQWSLNGTPISGATSQTLSATASGTYSVTVTGANTCSGTDDIVVTMNTAAATPTVTAAGPTTFCSGGSVALTAASATTGATYEWFLDGTAITGATSATYTANAAGNYTVVATANGCPSAASSATAVTVNTAAATPTITAAGPTTFCSGGSVTLTAASTSTGATYEWFLDGTVITGATSATYTANAAGNYTVIATASGCPSVASAATAVTVNATPATPTITQNGGTLTSSAATGNQWYLNGTAIAGATSQTHVTTTNGAYTVIVTGANTCPSPVSATVNVTNTGVADALAGMSVQVYPNPASGSFNVKLNGYQKEATMVLYNLAGQQITVEKLAADGQAKNINIRGLAAGTYLLKITSDKGVQVSRLLVE